MLVEKSKELKSSSDKIEFLDQQIKDLKDSETNYKSQLDEKEQKVAEAMTNLKSKEKELENRSKRISDLESELSGFQHQLSATVTELKDQLSLKDVELKSFKSQINDK